MGIHSYQSFCCFDTKAVSIFPIVPSDCGLIVAVLVVWIPNTLHILKVGKYLHRNTQGANKPLHQVCGNCNTFLVPSGICLCSFIKIVSNNHEILFFVLGSEPKIYIAWRINIIMLYRGWRFLYRQCIFQTLKGLLTALCSNKVPLFLGKLAQWFRNSGKLVDIFPI